MIVKADGAWEVQFHHVVLGANEDWRLVEFFVFLPHGANISVIALVLENGRLEPVSGKLRKTA